MINRDVSVSEKDLQALESSIASLSERDRAILKFHFVEGMNIEALGTIYGVHRATACIAKRPGATRSAHVQNEARLKRTYTHAAIVPAISPP